MQPNTWRPGLLLATAAVLAIVAVTVWYLSKPSLLTIAVPGQSEPEARVLVAFAHALEEQQKNIRLKIVQTADVEESAKKLQQGEVDLALVRGDVFLPSNGLTVAIMSEPTILLLAPTDDLTEAAQWRVGLIGDRQADLNLLSAVLESYDIKVSDVQVLASSALPEALASKRIDAVAIVAPIGPAVSRLVATAQKAAEPDLRLVSIEGETSASSPGSALFTTTIPPGTLGTRPRLPAEETRTLATSYRLMAQADLDRGPVSELTENLFQMRSRIAISEPGINRMKAPADETAMSAALPNHPGAIDYLTREQQTFMDRYGDWVWLGLFLGGGASSAGAWIAQMMSRRKRERIANVLDRLLDILRDARSATETATLDKLALEIDTLVMEAIQNTQTGATDATTMSALVLAMDAARTALSDRRAMLTEHVSDGTS